MRDVTQADLGAVLALLDQLREGSSQPDRAIERIDERHSDALREIDSSPNLHLLVAEVEGSIVGTCALAFIPNISHGGRPWCVLENMVVDEAARGTGVGHALIERSLELARRHNCYKLSLTSNLKRADAHRFYESTGFAHTHKGFTVYFD